MNCEFQNQNMEPDVELIFEFKDNNDGYIEFDLKEDCYKNFIGWSVSKHKDPLKVNLHFYNYV